jgi:hypothetical protein
VSGAKDHQPSDNLHHRIRDAERAMLRTLDSISERLATGADIMLLCHALAGQQESLAKLLAEKDERQAQQPISRSGGRA